MDEFLNIDTPENVIFGYELAGIGSRFLAALVDSFLIVVLQVVAYGFLLLIIQASGTGNDLLDLGAAFVVALSTFIAFAFLWGYYIFFEMIWNGQSPGKRLAGLRVIQRDGTPITLTESLIRNLVRIIDFLPAYYGVGVVSMFFDGQARRLGDMAAGTLVVFDRTGVTLESLKEVTGRPTLTRTISPAVARLPISRLHQDDIQLAESFLARQESLPNAASLSQRIVQKLYRQMKMEPPNLTTALQLTHLTDLVYLARYPDAPVAAEPQHAEPATSPLVLAPLPARLPTHLLAESDFLIAAEFLRVGQFALNSDERAHQLVGELFTKMGLNANHFVIPSAAGLLAHLVQNGREDNASA